MLMIQSQHLLHWKRKASLTLGSSLVADVLVTTVLHNCKNVKNKSITQSTFNNLILCCVCKIFMLTVKVIVSIFV